MNHVPIAAWRYGHSLGILKAAMHLSQILSGREVEKADHGTRGLYHLSTFLDVVGFGVQPASRPHRRSCPWCISPPERGIPTRIWGPLFGHQGVSNPGPYDLVVLQ